MQQACRFRRVAQARPGTAHLARAQYLLLHSSIRCNASASMQQGEQEAPAPSVTIVGAGAAGLTAAFFAAEHGAKVTVLERTREAGKKILMSGGSRCNVLPVEVDIASDFFSDSPSSAVRAVFASWSLDLCKAWLEDPYWGVGLDLVEEPVTRKYFPASNSSRDVRDRLTAAALQRGVSVRYNSSVEGLRYVPPPQSEVDVGSAEAHTAQDTLVHEAASSSSCINTAGSEREPHHTHTQAEDASTSCPSDSSSSSGMVSSPSKGKSGKSKRGVALPPSLPSGGHWVCTLADGSEVVSEKIIVATGGLSFPAVGTDGTGHRILRSLGISVEAPYPALTPLTGAHPGGEQLAGLSQYSVELSCSVPGLKKPKLANRTGLLFTHKGYSGPSILDLSHHVVKALERGGKGKAGAATAGSTTSTASTRAAQQLQAAAAQSQPQPQASSQDSVPQQAQTQAPAQPKAVTQPEPPAMPRLLVNWTNEPEEVWNKRLMAGGPAMVTTVLQRAGLRERLAHALALASGCIVQRGVDDSVEEEGGSSSVRCAQLKKGQRAALLKALTAFPLEYAGHEGYKKAEVTGGGVPLSVVDCASLEVRAYPGLHVCGEICDVFGRIGGFNFYWAWVSGRLAGMGAAQGGVHPKAKKGKEDRKLAATAAAV